MKLLDFVKLGSIFGVKNCFPCDVNEKDDRGITPLIYAAIVGNLDMINLLLEMDANVNEKTHSGATALHCAASKGYLKAAQSLIRNGADVNCRDEHNSTPLINAVCSGNGRLVEFLLFQGVDINVVSLYGNFHTLSYTPNETYL